MAVMLTISLALAIPLSKPWRSDAREWRDLTALIEACLIVLLAALTLG